MKKIVSSFLALLIVAAFIPSSFASSYTYLDKAGWTATATSTNQKFTADKMIDGNPESYWHSDYRSENDMDKPPFYLTFTLPENVTIGGWRYIPRTSNASGIVTAYNIYVSEEASGKAYLIHTGRMENSYDTKEVPFDFNVKNVKTVILEITEGMYNYGVVAEFDLMASVSGQADKSISEASLGSTVTIGKADEDDTPLIPKTGWKASATTTNKNFTADKMIDGNPDSYWHSDYRSESDMDKPPFYLTFNLPEKVTVGGWRYTPRSDNSAGIVTEYNLYAADSDSGKARLIYTGKMASDFKKKVIPFGHNISGIKTVILEITSGAYNFGTCAEFDLLAEIPEQQTGTISDFAIASKTVEIGTNKIEGYASDFYEDKASWAIVASSAHKRNKAEHVIDGKRDTYWHTDYTDDGVATILTKVNGPHWFEITLPEAREISGFTYVPRQTSQNTGVFTGYEFYGAATDDGEWVLLKSGSWASDTSDKKEALLKNVKVKKVKLISDGSVADFGTCAEFELKIPDEKLETEENLSSYTEFFMANKVTEIDLSGASATATSEWEKNPVRNLLDGNQRVAYHSAPEDKDKFPVVITVDLGDVYTVSEIEYIPRIDDTTKHGIWTDFAVWASLDGDEYVPALENGALELHLNNQKIKFEKPVKGRYFEFEVNEGYRGYVTCGDLKFFERAEDTDEREAEVKEKYVLQIGSNVIKTEKNGVSSEKQIDVAPFIDSGYTQIPLRGLLEEMGASLTWDGERQKIDITGDGIKIEMQIMNDAVYVTNDRLGRVRYTLQTPPQIKDSRTFVPLRFISENLGYNVVWNGETQEITITK